MKFLAKIRDAVMNFLKRIFTAAGRLKARGERLAKLNLTGEPKAKDFVVKGLAKRLAVGTKVEVDPVKGLQELCKLISSSVKWDEQALKTASELKADVLKILDSSIPSVTSMGSSDVRSLGAPVGFKKIEREGVWGFESPVLPGNVQFEGSLKTSEGKLEVGDKVMFFGATIRKNVAKVAVAEESTVPVQSTKAIAATAKAVSGLIRVVNDAVSFAGKAVKEARSTGSIFKAKGFNASERGRQIQLLGVYRAMAAIPGQLTSKLCAHAIGVAAAYVELAERSAVQYAKAKSSNESIAYSEEGVKGAIVGFLTGAAATPLVVTRALHGAAFKASREKLKSEILQISDRIAAIRNGDIEKAKKSGIKIDEKDLKPIDKFEVAKSAALGLIVPFYGTYQGHKREELQEELKAKIKELRKEFAKQGIHS